MINKTLNSGSQLNTFQPKKVASQVSPLDYFFSIQLLLQEKDSEIVKEPLFLVFLSTGGGVLGED